jgi:hypothetical protein
MAHHAASRHDTAYLGKFALGPGTLCRRHARDSRELLSPRSQSAPEYLIVDKGKLAGAGAHSYTAGDATKGVEEAAKFKETTKT